MANPFDDHAVRNAFGAAGITHRPGMADDLLTEMAPLLAAEGIDLNDPSTFDMESLNAALGRAIERTNMERFTPFGVTRANTLAVLRLTSEAISEGNVQIAEVVIRGIEPEPKTPDKPSVAHVIGVSLGLLDTWHGDPGLSQSLTRVRVPKWPSRPRAAATDMIALAQKGRAFESVGALHRRFDGLTILEGSILAVTGTLQTWAASTNQSVRELGLTALAEPN